MRKVSLTFGLLAGAMVSAFLVVTIVLWVKTGKIIDYALVGYATMVIALSMVFFGVKSYRDNYQSGKIKFWKGFQVGLLITLIASLMYTITWETYVQVSPGSSQAFVDYLKSPKNTPSIAVGLDGDEFGIVGAWPTIN